jgi:hypothetical protein
MRQTTEGSWAAATEQVDWNKIDATDIRKPLEHAGDERLAETAGAARDQDAGA